ncbi:ADP-ribosylglycohydrolase family protein [Gaetbulibacter saemankumensis]|uniref:ADP-ribosylglycohydrolase family protein n=1 Tax=Gaetbulibacter saemankumensis TaxID=311208 RepID=UPI000425A103|nr:ADP-ribosylglycohydrolase family protein [Gaetbulibacter saemankumensis]
MIGAIIGDIVGSIYEFDNHKSKEFDLFSKESTFTDDTVMTVAITEFLLLDRQISQSRLCSHLYDWYKKYPQLHLTYGRNFVKWLNQFETTNYVLFKKGNSYGNGAAMRVSSVPSLTFGDIRESAKFVTEVSHSHPEGIKGAQAVVVACKMAITHKSKEQIKKAIEEEFGYDLNRTVEQLRETYEYNETCQRTVPEAIVCFLESTDFEDAIRNAISIGGDSDTLACITGSIAEKFYKDIPEKIIVKTLSYLPKEMLDVVYNFYSEAYYDHKNLSEIIMEQLAEHSK